MQLTAMFAPAILGFFVASPLPPVLDCPLTCPNATVFDDGETGTLPAGVIIIITPGVTESGTRKDNGECNKASTCKECKSAYEIEVSYPTGYTVELFDQDADRTGTLGSGTDIEKTMVDHCNSTQWDQYTLLDDEDELVYQVSVIMDCNCDE